MTVAVVGAVALDDIETPGGAVRGVLGGSAAYAAAAAAMLEAVHVISVIGDDLPAAALEPLRRRGVRLEGVSVVPGATFRWGARYRDNLEDRDTLFTSGGVFGTNDVAVPVTAAGSTHVFLTAGEPRQNRAALSAFSQRRLTMLDTIERELVERRPELLEVMRQADIVSINEKEAALLVGEHEREAGDLAASAYRFVAGLGPQTLLLKRGPRGVAVLQAGQRTQIAALSDSQVVDPTGAGDSFGGATLAAMARGAPLLDAVRWGCALASFTVESFGLDGVLRATIDETRKRAERLGLHEAEWLAIPASEGAAV